jgi:3-oxoacyl-[acyl-carrier protein] reductase
VLADIKDGGTLERELKTRGEAAFVRTDVASEAETQALAEATEKAYGRIDVLINNAGLFTVYPRDELTYGEWKMRMRVNVDGTFLATKAVVPAMRKQGRGKIINIGSDTVWMGTPGFVHYVASKGAVMAFTRALANELGRDGITSVYVTPTLLDTTGTRAAFPQGHFDYVLSHTPIGKFENPDDVAGLIVYLCSDEAGFVNGVAINIGGGISMH